MIQFVNLMWCLLVVVFLAPKAFGDNKVVFQFPEYDYKETSKNELAFREFESACDQSARCLTLEGIEKTRCVRECVSPSCYKEIYKFDELEEGEIDVRLNSFRACFMQRLNRNRG
ncbi:AAEL005183-PA [Aedes aegypti]|uniref:AAEL005183-PA n=1 Tax=Aedes aegypti TaxID=7159 RepID=Q17AU5_AEDAE|nr:AAEL005183-PA [Aedes aegypti]